MLTWKKQINDLGTLINGLRAELDHTKKENKSLVRSNRSLKRECSQLKDMVVSLRRQLMP